MIISELLVKRWKYERQQRIPAAANIKHYGGGGG